MAQLKVGSRLRSAVCTTQVMVVAAPTGDVEVTCGGEPMVGMDETPPAGGTPAPGADGGTALGKRYTNEAGDLELLCTKPGDGSLSAGGEALAPRDAKALPSSD